MMGAIRFGLWSLARVLVPLRYRIEARDWEQIRNLKNPVLILPNHPAYIDPLLILTAFFGRFRPRTVLYEGNFPSPIRRLLVNLLQAVSVPDLVHPSQESHQRAEQAIAEIIAGLHRGENFVLWPSGRAQRDGVERIGAARALAEILRAVPEAQIVLVRTRGLWGSMFSYARTGQAPHLGKCLLNGILLLAANLFLLMPRRRVDIHVSAVDRNEFSRLDRDSINRRFEAHYNCQGPESPTYIPYHFLFGPWSYQFPPLAEIATNNIDLAQVPCDIRLALMEILSEQMGRELDAAEFQPETKLDDLGLDSLQRMDLALTVEQRFLISGGTAPETIGQLIALAQGLEQRSSPKSPPWTWFQPPSNVEPLSIPGETIPAAFVARALTAPRNIVAADDLSGVLSYEKLLVGALLVAQRFSRLPTTNIGLMLPASVASDIMLLGLYLANKRPVLLNWTTGPANLQHAVQLTGLTHVVTSRHMRDRLAISIQNVQYLDVEDLNKEFGWFQKLKTLLLVRWLPNRISRLVPRQEPEEDAVVLFTSGSEKAPKAVPLTHRNIISNLRILPAILDLTTRDAVLGFLPMFHSFGFTMTGLFPLLGGIRVVHHPDPTDLMGLVRKIAGYQPTVLVGMPSLVEHLFHRAQPEELKSLRLIAVGAEKASGTLFELVHRIVPKAQLLEGYGVTECSPAVIANTPHANRPGTIGRPLPGVTICVVDLETDDVLPPGKLGMLLVNGPGVFHGYLGHEASPFVFREGKQWYVTGDLVEVDAEGFVHFRGRLKRFVKSGGEMISLPALEDPFTQAYPPGTEGPQVAVEGVETENGRQIVLFTTVPVSLKEANARLADAGFRGVMRLDEVRRMDRIPVLGTGKTDYRQLRNMLTKNTAVNHLMKVETL